MPLRARGAAPDCLSQVLGDHRGVPLAGYMPIRTEIDPLPAMAEAAAHGPVGVPVIDGCRASRCGSAAGSRAAPMAPARSAR